MDDQLGSLKGKIKINKYALSDEINDFWKQEGYSQPPYNSKSVVQQVELLEDTKLVSVYDEVHTQLSGGWLMNAEDIKGLTPAQIKVNYALDFDPIYVGEATNLAGSKINIGEVSGGGVGQPGGGIQIDLNNFRIGEFKELGKITDWSFGK